MTRWILGVLLLGCSSSPLLIGDVTEVAELEKGAQAVDHVLSSKSSGTVVLRGRIGRVCDEGCWFYLMGEQGLLYVKLDLSSHVVLPRKSQGREALVRGTLVQEETGQVLQGEGIVLF